tara:strand:+ start:207 stop:389 length:183 start_codon:yes stop_codon:yes gene_type:complete
MGCDFSRMSCLLAENKTFMREVLHILMNLQAVRTSHFAQGRKKVVGINQLCSVALASAGL